MKALSFPPPYLILLGLCLVAGTVWDVVKRRVPNAITLAIAIGGVVAQVMTRGGLAALLGVGAGALTVVLLYRPWVARAIGGGDVKLAAGLAIWVGLGSMITYGLAVGACGGVAAILAYLLSRRAARQEMRTNLALAALQQGVSFSAKAPGRVSVPYGAAIAAGALITLLGT